MNTIDLLMDKLAEELTDADIDEIIIWTRKQLESYNSGTKKPKTQVKEEQSVEAQSVIQTMIAKIATKPKVGKLKRRL